MNYEEQKLKINSTSDRLELDVDGNIAFIEYELSNKTLFLLHTEVPPVLEGKGVGKAIVEKALQYAKENHYKVAPRCTFVQSYLKRHSEWNDIVSSDAERSADKH